VWDICWKHVQSTVNAAPSGAASLPHPESSMPPSGVNPVWLQENDVLSESERRVRLMLDSAAEAICACDSSGTCLFANCSAARILGYGDRAELFGRNVHSLEHHTRKDGTPYPIQECPIDLGFQKGESVHRDDEVYWRTNLYGPMRSGTAPWSKASG
jgi:PAS domain S-box-containing protein